MRDTPVGVDFMRIKRSDRIVTRWQRRRFVGAALLGVGLAGVALGSTAAQPVPPDLGAEIRVFDSATPYNSYPDACDQRLSRLYIAEDLELSIQVQFSRALSDVEAAQVRWEVTNEAAIPSSGDFVGHANPTLVTTIVSANRRTDTDEALVRVTYQGADIAAPLPVRVISNEEYATALTTLSSFTAVGGRPRSQLPLTADLLARFVGQDSTGSGVPSVGTAPLSICDARLTHRAGAIWGSGSVADVPLVEYGPDQPASNIVAGAAARALLSEHAEQIGEFFVANPQAATLDVQYPYSGGLNLNRPLDAALALHSVQFDGTVTATVDAPTSSRALLTARAVRVTGSVSDLYDFNLEAGGGGAFAAAEGAKLEIASVKHTLGKVFVVSFKLESSIDSLDF